MTDIDIERLRNGLRLDEHKSTCAAQHSDCSDCAVLALIERLEKAEAQRDRIQAELAEIKNKAYQLADKNVLLARSIGKLLIPDAEAKTNE